MEVENTITLSSYMDTLMMSLMMGIVFEIYVLCWLCNWKFLTADFYEAVSSSIHAIVIILIVGAVIAPTSDVFDDDGVCAYVALRSRHLDCKSDWEETAGRIRRGSA